MIKLGEKQELVVKRKVEFGAYLGVEEEDGEVVLLPNSQMKKDLAVKDKVEVFVYKDSEDRIVSTMREPNIKIGEVRSLKVVDIAKIGAFLDWGLDKDLFLPFKEQRGKVKKDDWVLVGIYIDKSDRVCGTMKIYNLLESESPYNENDKINGIVYDISKGLGVLVAVDDKYHGLIHESEVYEELKIGKRIEARVIKKKSDGKLDLAIRKKSYRNIDKDSKKILDLLISSGGTLPLSDKSNPELIKSKLNMSKNAFKKSIGRLFKDRKIIIHEDKITIVR